MATVIEHGNGSQVSSMWDKLPNMTTVVIVGSIILLAIVIFYFWKKLEEERKSKEEPLFYDYISTLQGCKDLSRKELVRFGYNWKFLLFPPLFFLGFIGTLRNDISVPIRDLNNKLLGRYRGEQNRNDGTYNLLICDGTRVFGLFENLKILKIPRGTYDEVNGVYYDMSEIVQFLPSKQNTTFIQIKCYDIEEYKYFYIPHVVDNVGKTVHLRGEIARIYNMVTNDLNIVEYFKQGTQQISGAFKMNSDLGRKQREPQERQELIDG